jgi:hypothetical protein
LSDSLGDACLLLAENSSALVSEFSLLCLLVLIMLKRLLLLNRMDEFAMFLATV